jgi:hypothetical protein
MTIELAKLQPLMLDWIGLDYLTKEKFALRGDDVPCYPRSDRVCLSFLKRSRKKRAFLS